MYDYAHSLSDALENITTLFVPLNSKITDLFMTGLLKTYTIPRPKQYEFSRLNLEYTVTSKRKLKELVDNKLVSNWDDPRMPTLIGMRRRGYPALAIKKFCERIGISKRNHN